MRTLGLLLAGYAAWHAYRNRHNPPIQSELLQLQRRMVENQMRFNVLLDQQRTSLNSALIAAINGDIGGKVGLGGPTAKY